MTEPGKQGDYVWMTDDEPQENIDVPNFAKTYKQKRVPNTSVAGYGRDFIENFELGCSQRCFY